jgi:hypothetical protein
MVLDYYLFDLNAYMIFAVSGQNMAGVVPIKIKISFAQLLSVALSRPFEYPSDDETDTDSESSLTPLTTTPENSPANSPSVQVVALPDEDASEVMAGNHADNSPGNSSVLCPALPIPVLPQEIYQSDDDATSMKTTGRAPKKRRRGRNKSEGAVKRQKQSGHKRRAASRREDKEEATRRPSNYIVSPFMEKKFVESAEPINVQYNASNFPSCSTGFVGLKGKVSKVMRKFKDLLGSKKTKYEVVKWPGMYVLSKMPGSCLMAFKVNAYC